ncbi:MAG: hypothetical protein MJ066_06115, partial [Clostridia bacterium]|nr:hypothetical protein [Clostridia bacterium]
HSDGILNEYINTINGKYITDLTIGSCKNKTLTLTLHNGSKVDYEFIEKDNGGLKFYDGTENVTLYRYQQGVHEEDNTIVYIQYANAFTPYDVSVNKNKTHNISISNINVNYDNTENYNYTVSYEDSVLNSGRIKVKMIALAANQELKILRYASQPANEPVEYKYFGTVAISLEDMGLISNKLDFSTRKTVFIFGVAGLLISFLVVYILSIIDTTVASRQDVEKLTGTPLLAYIEDVKKEEDK